MGTGQMLISIGAIVLLGTIILTTNRGIESSSEVMLDTGYGIDAVSLATSTIEKAQDLAFDEATRGDTLGDTKTLAQLTPPSSLGEESADSDGFDDYDDYNGPTGGPSSYLIQTDTLPTGSIYDIKTEVHYVYRDASGNIDISSSTTWSKQLDVWVWNAASPADTVHMTDVFSYWY